MILVHILCLDDCIDTTIMPQPTEITQFIFGQPLLASGPGILPGTDDRSAVKKRVLRCSPESKTGGEEALGRDKEIVTRLQAWL